jgi:hypothetical protein
MRRVAGYSVTLLWLSLVCGTAFAAPSIEASTFTAGPRITPAGLVWLAASGPMLGQSKVSLAGAKSFPWASATSPPLSSPSSRWIVADSGRELEAERLGSVWRRLPALSRCPALTVGRQPLEAPDKLGLVALAGDQLFAVVDPRCLHRRGYGRAALLSASLATGSWRLLAPAPKDVLAIGAAPGRVVLAAGELGELDAPRRLALRVYDARDGRYLYGVNASASDRDEGTAPSLRSLTASVDAAGDVLIGESVQRPPPVPTGSFAWWATPARRYPHEISEVLTSEASLDNPMAYREPTPTAEAALSAGRIAYATGNEGSTEIELISLRNSGVRVAARLLGEVGVLGLALSPSELAWAQQSSFREGHSHVVPGGVASECKQVVLSGPQLMSVGIGSLPASGLTIGLPVPPGTPACGPES